LAWTLYIKNPVHEREMNKHDPMYSLACGTAPITFVERDGACSVVTGKTTTGTVAARSPISISASNSNYSEAAI